MGMTATPPIILFLCVANSPRRQMAEGLARDMFGRAVRIQLDAQVTRESLSRR